MIKICLFGGGNITNLRHIPALQRTGRSEIMGLIGGDSGRSMETVKKLDNTNLLVLKEREPIKTQIEEIPWFLDSDAVLIGTPPRSHYAIAKACLELGKHVLVEKPMVMNLQEGAELIEIADRNRLILAVMHNFQFADSAKRLIRQIERGNLGAITSYNMVQFTSRDRRLPSWYQELPLGLFYDEAAHFFYLLQRVGGQVTILDAFGQMSSEHGDNTPLQMSASMEVGGVPANLLVNFSSPVCEWFFAVAGERKLAIYDFFRDILVTIPNDRQHLAGDILRTSALATLEHWMGFISSGFKLVTGNLYYGVDVVLNNFFDSIDSGLVNVNISADRGLDTVRMMNDVVDKIAERNIKVPRGGDL